MSLFCSKQFQGPAYESFVDDEDRHGLNEKVRNCSKVPLSLSAAPEYWLVIIIEIV